MPFSSEILVKVIILVLGLCGLAVAKHIHNHKAKKMPLVCMVGFDCHTVVHSDYSKFMGVPVEIAGMIYYAFISLVYLFLIFWEGAMPQGMVVIPIVISLIAFLFSAYLIAVQIFILKKGCSWCIVSSLISALIFTLTLFTYDFSSVAQIFLK